MKGLFKTLVTLFIVVMSVFCLSCAKDAEEITPISLGIPTEKATRFGVNRSPWDMIYYEGKLYIGNGDYTDNAGPITVWSYNPDDGSWTDTGSLPDEAITKFKIIDGALAATGTDPIDEWDLGNYYRYENGQWSVIRSIPEGVHNFDLEEYDGKIFASLGVPAGQYPIAASEDGGKTFTQVMMYKNGAPLDTRGYETVRSYNIFKFKDELYISYYGHGDKAGVYELYKYENGVFTYQRDLSKKIGHMDVSQATYLADVEYKDKYYIATGYMLVTEDMKEFKHMKFENHDIVYDFIVKNDKLYCLTGYKAENGKFRISVYENTTGKESKFREILYFYYDAPCISFEYGDGSFYIGIGSSTAAYSQNGEILKVDFVIE